MIYFVTRQTSISESFQRASLQDVISYLQSIREVALDTETNGFDPHTKNMLTLQLGDAENQYVIDCSTIDILPLKASLERVILLGHNLKFDLKFLYKKGIYPRKIYDTFVVEKLLHCGFPDVRMGLDHVANRYLGVTLDKTIRGSIHKEGLTDRVIKYAAEDTAYLHEIKRLQTESLKSKNMIGVSNLENRFTPSLAYIEYCGIKLDSGKWRAKMKIDQEGLIEAEGALNKFILDRGLIKFIDPQMDLFRPARCSINWASPKQVIEVLEHFGVNCNITEKGKEKKSVEASVIQKQSSKSPIVGLYLEYKKADKVVSTYGETFLNHINKVTGRVHSQYHQIMNTGRISSGGSDKDNDSKFPNLQNIPHDEDTRSCFVAEDNRSLIIGDYTAQEQVVLANKSLDPGLLEFYDKELGDTHSYVASKIFPELKDVPLKEIKEKYKPKRDQAKVSGLAINYGGVGATIADNLGLPLEEGEHIYTSYMAAFPGLASYFDKSKAQCLRDGYVLISPPTGRKSYYYHFSKFSELHKELNIKGFWEHYRSAKKDNSPEFSTLKLKVSDYFRYKGEMERMSLNYPIQGTSGEISKIACIYVYDYIVDNDLFGKVLFANVVHDELVVESPNDMKEEILQMVKKSMIRAGEIYCKRVPLKVSIGIHNCWVKD